MYEVSFKNKIWKIRINQTYNNTPHEPKNEHFWPKFNAFHIVSYNKGANRKSLKRLLDANH